MLGNLRASSAPAPWIKSVNGGQEMENARGGRNHLLHSDLHEKKKKRKKKKNYQSAAFFMS